MDLVRSGVGTIATTALWLFLKLPDATIDPTPWVHWRLPTILKEDPAAADGVRFWSPLNMMSTLNRE